jgi:hypothetical protein
MGRRITLEYSIISATAALCVVIACCSGVSLRQVGPLLLTSVCQPSAAAPQHQLVARHALLLVVVEFVADVVGLAPGEGLLHRVAVLDAVDPDHGASASEPCEGGEGGGSMLAQSISIVHVFSKEVPRIIANGA